MFGSFNQFIYRQEAVGVFCDSFRAPPGQDGKLGILRVWSTFFGNQTSGKKIWEITGADVPE
jgi:hypothetical protein